MPSLDSAYAQVDRSGEHLAELKRLHDEVCAEQAKSTIVNLKSEGAIKAGETLPLGEVQCPQPPVATRIRIITGEISNCFRAALDYLVAELALLDSGVRQKRPRFPIADSPKDFKEARRSGLEGLSDTHKAAIERLQPYNGCGWTKILAILSNFYKHNDLVWLRHGVLIAAETMPVDPTESNPFKHAVRVDIKNVIHISLNEGFPLIQTLEILKSQVTQTLDAFQPEFK